VSAASFAADSVDLMHGGRPYEQDRRSCPLERLQTGAATLGTPTILASTDPYLLEQVRAAADRCGSHPVSGKPFDIADLVATFHTIIGRV
jgi:hypothetical protein